MNLRSLWAIGAFLAGTFVLACMLLAQPLGDAGAMP